MVNFKMLCKLFQVNVALYQNLFFLILFEPEEHFVAYLEKLRDKEDRVRQQIDL